MAINNRKVNDSDIYIYKFIEEHPFLSELVQNDGISFECNGDVPSLFEIGFRLIREVY